MSFLCSTASQTHAAESRYFHSPLHEKGEQKGSCSILYSNNIVQGQQLTWYSDRDIQKKKEYRKNIYTYCTEVYRSQDWL